MNNRIKVLAIASLLVSLSGCNAFKVWVATEFKQHEVASGIARLSAQNVSMIGKVAAERLNGPGVTASIALDPKEHGKGHVKLTLEHFDIDYPLGQEVYRDCLGDKGKWFGKVHVIKAEQIMYGRITNNTKNPIIPDHDGIVIKVQAEVAGGYTVKFKNNPHIYLEMNRGKIAFEMIPRLAQNQTESKLKGLRVAQTNNVRLKNIKMNDMEGTLHSPEIILPFDISDSLYEMQVGEGDDGKENHIAGRITMFGYERQIPLDGNTLDPDYSRDKFVSKFSCNKDLQGKVAYGDVRFEHTLGHGAAALTTLVIGEAMKRFRKDRVCGLESPKFFYNTKLDTENYPFGHGVSEFNGECVVEFAADTLTEPDCFGVAHKISGVVKITKAKQTLSGRLLAQNMDEYTTFVDNYEMNIKEGKASDMIPAPAIPTTRRPVELEIEATVENLTIRNACSDKEGSTDHAAHCSNRARESLHFTIHKGTVKGTFAPTMAKDLMGVCKEPTPASTAKMQITDVWATLKADGNELRLVANGNFNVVSGKVDAAENELQGEVKIGSIPVRFTSEGRNFRSLDPTYERQEFRDSFYSCKNDTIVEPTSDNDCLTEDMIGGAIARCLVANAGGILKVVSSPSVPNSLQTRAALNNLELLDDKNTVHLTTKHKRRLRIDNDIHKDVNQTYDSAKTETKLEGKIKQFTTDVTVRGTPISKPYEVFGFNVNPMLLPYVSGFINKYVNKRNEILVRPTNPDAHTLEITAKVEDFATKMKFENKLTYEPHVIMAGDIKIKATPIMGLDERTIKDETPSYSIETPVVHFQNIKFKGPLKLSLMSDNVKLSFFVKAELEAYNGRYNNRGNYIKGSIDFSVDTDDKKKINKVHHIKIDDHLMPRVMLFDQKKFDESYEDTKYLHKVVNSGPVVP